MGRVVDRWSGLPRVPRPRDRRLVHRCDCGLKRRKRERSAAMTIAELLLPEFDQEMAATRKVLERVPDDKLAWKAHPKSNTIGWVSSHLADLPNWITFMLGSDSLDIDPPG